jgi:hypothetical protein
MAINTIETHARADVKIIGQSSCRMLHPHDNQASPQGRGFSPPAAVEGAVFASVVCMETHPAGAPAVHTPRGSSAPDGLADTEWPPPSGRTAGTSSPVYGYSARLETDRAHHTRDKAGVFAAMSAGDLAERRVTAEKSKQGHSRLRIKLHFCVLWVRLVHLLEIQAFASHRKPIDRLTRQGKMQEAAALEASRQRLIADMEALPARVKRHRR